MMVYIYMQSPSIDAYIVMLLQNVLDGLHSQNLKVSGGIGGSDYIDLTETIFWLNNRWLGAHLWVFIQQSIQTPN